MGALSYRDFPLETPTDVEGLWARLATLLPVLVRRHLPYPHIAERNSSTALAQLHGPELVQNDTTRTYKCSERGVFGELLLRAIVHDGQTHRSFALNVTQRTVSNGMLVMSLWNSGGRAEAIDTVGLQCRYDDIDEMVALLRGAIAIRK